MPTSGLRGYMPSSPVSVQLPGSASELGYHLLLAKDLELIKPREHEELAQRTIEVKRMLTALVQKLSADR